MDKLNLQANTLSFQPTHFTPLRHKTPELQRPYETRTSILFDHVNRSHHLCIHENNAHSVCKLTDDLCVVVRDVLSDMAGVSLEKENQRTREQQCLRRHKQKSIRRLK